MPKRKQIRLEEYDYASCGMYFVTICVKNHQPLLWNAVGADTIRPQDAPPLSNYGKIVYTAIENISNFYPQITVNKYCVMPNHVHLLLFFGAGSPELSIVVGQMKRWASKQCGIPIWQKSFYEHVIRNYDDYQATWQYIDENPLKWQLSEHNYSTTP